MLVNVRTSGPQDPMMYTALSVLGGHPQTSGQNISGSKGLYLIHHFNFNHVVETPILDEYPEFPDLKVTAKSQFGDEDYTDTLSAYGVCDSPAQFMAVAGEYLDKSPRAFAVSFTEIRRADQPPEGGWRWHKWGPYIGACKPTTEYLYDERFIDSVFVYHVYEFKSEDC
jgi:hypothetical protein